MGRALGVSDSTADIDGGVIKGVTLDGSAIGSTTTSTGKFTGITGTSLTVNGNAAIGSTSAQTLGFHGATAVAQRQSSVAPAVATTVGINSSISSSCFGFTSGQCVAIIALVNELRAAAVELGLIAT